jgi:hypothetical protein
MRCQDCHNWKRGSPALSNAISALVQVKAEPWGECTFEHKKIFVDIPEALDAPNRSPSYTMWDFGCTHHEK